MEYVILELSHPLLGGFTHLRPLCFQLTEALLVAAIFGAGFTSHMYSSVQDHSCSAQRTRRRDPLRQPLRQTHPSFQATQLRGERWVADSHKFTITNFWEIVWYFLPNLQTYCYHGHLKGERLYLYIYSSRRLYYGRFLSIFHLLKKFHTNLSVK